MFVAPRHATHKWPSSNVCRSSACDSQVAELKCFKALSLPKDGALTLRGVYMQAGSFYFLKDIYFTDFHDKNLMRNSETIQSVKGRRPCFLRFI